MANENPSRENPSRQQSGERAQAGSTQQGTGSRAAGQGSAAHGQGGYATPGHGAYGEGTGTSTWQVGRSQAEGGALASRRGSPATPYSGYPGRGAGPFSMMRRISDEMDRLFESFGMGRGLFPGEAWLGGASDVAGSGEGAASMWSPHIEVCERDGKLLIQADLPGMKRDDINVRVEQDLVVIQGERQQDRSKQQDGYYRSERSYGSFYRTIPLPEGANPDSATASFRDGVLEIELDAPREQSRGRMLEIREGASPGGARAGGAPQHTGAGSTAQQSASGPGGSQQSASGSAGSRES